MDLRRLLENKEGMGESLLSLGILRQEQGKIEEAEKLYLESVEITVQFGELETMHKSLINLEKLYREQDKIEELEKVYYKYLKYMLQWGDKKGIAMGLNNLGILNFEKGKLESARIFYSESLSLKIALNDTPGIISIIHRSFLLMDDSEKDKYYSMAKSLIDESTKPDQLSQMANIELMNYCIKNKNIDNAIIREYIKHVVLQKEKSTLQYFDDLPIEAFYCLALKLNEIGEKELVKLVAHDALKMIGELNSIRKDYFQKATNLNCA